MAVVQTTARVAKLIKPTLLSVFLETRHCRRMSTEKSCTGAPSPRSSDVQLNARSPTLATRNDIAARPGEGRKRRDSKVEKEERLKVGSTTVINSRIQPRSKRKKQREEKKSAFIEKPKFPIQLSNSSSDLFKRDEVLSPQTTASLPPHISSGNPMFIDEQTPSPEQDLYDDDAGDFEDFRQMPNPPFPKSQSSPHSSGEGISGKAAAIAYLRIHGLANNGRWSTFFTLLAWVLRHAARDLGFEIVPDGFVRVSDLLRFEPFQSLTLEEFARACTSDNFDRFEVMSLPDLINGQLREIWWARARACQTIPGVQASNKRIINMGRLQTVAYRASLSNWPKIQKYGIVEDPDRLIRLYRSGASYFRSIIPRHSKHICITIDAPKAAALGVMFFHTQDVELIAVGKNGAIPVEAIRSVVELEVTKESLI